MPGTLTLPDVLPWELRWRLCEALATQAAWAGDHRTVREATHVHVSPGEPNHSHATWALPNLNSACIVITSHDSPNLSQLLQNHPDT